MSELDFDIHFPRRGGWWIDSINAENAGLLGGWRCLDMCKTQLVLSDFKTFEYRLLLYLLLSMLFDLNLDCWFSIVLCSLIDFSKFVPFVHFRSHHTPLSQAYFWRPPLNWINNVIVRLYFRIRAFSSGTDLPRWHIILRILSDFAVHSHIPCIACAVRKFRQELRIFHTWLPSGTLLLYLYLPHIWSLISFD